MSVKVTSGNSIDQSTSSNNNTAGISGGRIYATNNDQWL